MTLLSNWLNSGPTKRKVMYIEQKVCEQFVIPDEEPLTRERELAMAFEYGFRAASSSSVFFEDIDRAWLENKKILL